VRHIPGRRATASGALELDHHPPVAAHAQAAVAASGVAMWLWTAASGALGRRRSAHARAADNSCGGLRTGVGWPAGRRHRGFDGAMRKTGRKICGRRRVQGRLGLGIWGHSPLGTPRLLGLFFPQWFSLVNARVFWRVSVERRCSSLGRKGGRIGVVGVLL
jgi:hypothetical protein